MARTKRLIRSFYRLLLPVVLILVIGYISASVWLAQSASNPPRQNYLMTPDLYGRLSARGAQVTDETWANQDGTPARGWLLRGAPGAPAVILMHSYGADRSHLLNLGVKLSETTNFTVLMPDLRGHGVDPKVKNTTFGGCETEDVLAAVKFLHSLRAGGETKVVGEKIGVYGVELGGLAALNYAAKDESIAAIALDSVPRSSDEILRTAINRKYPFAGFLTSKIAENGTYLYFFEGCYNRQATCEIAKNISNRQIFMLGGADNESLRDSTENLSKCFSKENQIETKFDLNPSGYNIGNASNEQSKAYDQKIIEFFNKALGGQMPETPAN